MSPGPWLRLTPAHSEAQKPALGTGEVGWHACCLDVDDYEAVACDTNGRPNLLRGLALTRSADYLGVAPRRLADTVSVMLGKLLGKLFGKTEAAEEARAAAGEARLSDDVANCFDVESAGPAQIRGNCSLVLGPEKLVSVMWKPGRSLIVPRSAMRRVDVVKSHLGKRTGVPLVKLRFVNDQGADDSVAWMVRDHERWLTQLKAACDG